MLNYITFRSLRPHLLFSKATLLCLHTDHCPGRHERITDALITLSASRSTEELAENVKATEQHNLQMDRQHADPCCFLCMAYGTGVMLNFYKPFERAHFDINGNEMAGGKSIYNQRKFLWLISEKLQKN